MDRTPLPSIADLTPFVGLDVPIVTPLADATLEAAFASVQAAPSGGSLVLELRTASSLLATITVANGQLSGSFAGSVAVTSGVPLVLRVASLAGSPSDLSGYLAFDADVLLTSISRVKEFKGIASTEFDALLLEIVEAVSRSVEGWIGRPIVQRTFSAERYSGAEDYPDLVLNGFPVIGTPVVRISGSALTANTDFRWEAANGILERLTSGAACASGWPSTSVVEVDSVRGYATVPADLRLATTKQCVHEFEQSKPGGARLGVTGKQPERGGAVQFAAGGFLPEVLQVLDRYREARATWRA